VRIIAPRVVPLVAPVRNEPPLHVQGLSGCRIAWAITCGVSQNVLAKRLTTCFASIFLTFACSSCAIRPPPANTSLSSPRRVVDWDLPAM
jgi:hypothetical protein